jgi:hypothetical protein
VSSEKEEKLFGGADIPVCAGKQKFLPQGRPSALLI